MVRVLFALDQPQPDLDAILLFARRNLEERHSGDQQYTPEAEHAVPRQPGKHDHDCSDTHHQQQRAQVGLEQQQQGDASCHQRDVNDRRPAFLDPLTSLREVAGKVDDERQLRELRRLYREAPHRNPPARSVERAMRQTHKQQRHGCPQEEAAPLPQPGQVHLGSGHQAGEADEGEGRLPEHEILRVIVEREPLRVAGAVEEGDPRQRHHTGKREQERIERGAGTASEKLQHVQLPRSAATHCRNCSPRSA
ncbi:MAG: hypothetical protein AUJ96_15600 [Armatimonadetes bacterium CG2_30_66_41]|nr:MAG: hypothetical protein AUJ96_15600 [Armatimonadetes bacterium CG2_30_66_41]